MKAPERVAPSSEREIIESPSTDVRHVDTEAQLVLAPCTGQKIGTVEVILGLPKVCLCTAPRECALHDNPRVRIEAGDRTVVMTDKKS